MVCEGDNSVYFCFALCELSQLGRRGGLDKNFAQISYTSDVIFAEAVSATSLRIGMRFGSVQPLANQVNVMQS